MVAFILWHVGFFLLGMVVTLVLHEFSHAIAFWAHGFIVTKFRPWPNPWRPVGRLGVIGWDAPRGTPNDRRERVRMRSAIAPLVKAYPLCLGWSVLGFFVWPPFFALAFWEMCDSLTWLLQFFDGRFWRWLWGKRFLRYDAQVYRRGGAKP